MSTSFNKHNSNIDYSKDKDYLSRKLISNNKPNFKLNAFCVNLESKENNIKFIKMNGKTI